MVYDHSIHIENIRLHVSSTDHHRVQYVAACLCVSQADFIRNNFTLYANCNSLFAMREGTIEQCLIPSGSFEIDIYSKEKFSYLRRRELLCSHLEFLTGQSGKSVLFANTSLVQLHYASLHTFMTTPFFGLDELSQFTLICNLYTLWKLVCACTVLLHESHLWIVEFYWQSILPAWPSVELQLHHKCLAFWCKWHHMKACLGLKQKLFCCSKACDQICQIDNTLTELDL